MKNFLNISTLAAFCIACIVTSAQETPESAAIPETLQPTDQAAPRRPRNRPRRPHLPPKTGSQARPRKPMPFAPGRPGITKGGVKPRSPEWIEKRRRMPEAFLEHLREVDPAEAKRLEHLRQNDLRAFRGAIELRLKERRLEQALQNHPKIMEVVNSLPQAEREDVVGILMSQGSSKKPTPEKKAFHIDGLPGVSDAASKGPHDPRPAGDAKRDEATFKLARTYRASQDPAERERINKEIQVKLEEIYDTREASQQQQVETIEATLLQLKKRIEMRKVHRDEIIEKRRQELTEDETLSW